MAIITAIAVAVVGGVTGRAKENATRRTAQVLAATAGGAQIAGDELIAAAADEAAVLDLLSDGVDGAGPFSGVQYRIPLTAADKLAVDPYLAFKGGILIYDASGNSAN